MQIHTLTVSSQMFLNLPIIKVLMKGVFIYRECLMISEDIFPSQLRQSSGKLLKRLYSAED